MASNYTHSLANSVSDIAMFGNFCKLSLPVGNQQHDLHDESVLRPDEVFFMRGKALRDDSTLAVALQEKLDLGTEYYDAVRHKIASVLALWDAVLQEKHRYDSAGWRMESRDFMDGFLLCSYIIPQRVNIGFLPTYVGGVPGLDACCRDIHRYGAGSHQPGPPAVNENDHPGTAEDATDYEDTIQDHRPGLPHEADPICSPEALALSPTFSTSQYSDAQGNVEVVSISSDDDDGDDYDDEGGDDDDESSDYNDEQLFKLDVRRALQHEAAEDSDESEGQDKDITNNDGLEVFWSQWQDDLNNSGNGPCETLHYGDSEKQRRSAEAVKLSNLAEHQPGGKPVGPQVEGSKKRNFEEIDGVDDEYSCDIPRKRISLRYPPVWKR